MNLRPAFVLPRVLVGLLLALLFALGVARSAEAHPLGNFTINHFARLQVGPEQIAVRYVVDTAEVTTFQEIRSADTNGDGTTSQGEFDAYRDRVAPQYAKGLLLTVDGARVPLRVASKRLTLPKGAGGLLTLRLECDFVGAVPEAAGTAPRRLRYEDTNHRERLGWHELVVTPALGASVFDSSAFGTAVTDELKAYPQELLTQPLAERVAELSFGRGSAPVGAKPLLSRNRRPVAPARDRLAELITVPQLTPGVVLVSVLVAAAFGALHAFAPGHGKTVVAAYLVGARGTVGHAAFLGLTVTITHTLGVFALGLVTLFASQYVLPEQLFPVLSLISGGLVLAIGLSLFRHRLRKVLGHAHSHHAHDHSHHIHDHAHEHHHHHHHHHADEHPHHPHSVARQKRPSQPAEFGESKTSVLPGIGELGASVQLGVHAHGGRLHSHLPPGAEGARVTWRSLLALGISGGLLPCPSALVVLLAAISLQRVGFGLLLVTAFSLGLAATLTALGIAFVYAGRLVKLPALSNRLTQALPTVSAFVITCVGAAIVAAETGKLLQVMS